jgi:K+-transporting ATPase KdpF subunit
VSTTAEPNLDAAISPQMVFDYWLAGLVTAGLLAYLTYALLRPAPDQGALFRAIANSGSEQL